MRSRVQLQASTPTSNDFGEEVLAWNLVDEVWAELDPMEGREFFNAARNQVEQPIKIRIRYRPDVHERMRVVKGSRVYDIQSVVNVGERNRELELVTVARA